MRLRDVISLSHGSALFRMNRLRAARWDRLILGLLPLFLMLLVRRTLGPSRVGCLGGDDGSRDVPPRHLLGCGFDNLQRNVQTWDDRLENLVRPEWLKPLFYSPPKRRQLNPRLPWCLLGSTGTLWRFLLRNARLTVLLILLPFEYSLVRRDVIEKSWGVSAAWARRVSQALALELVFKPFEIGPSFVKMKENKQTKQSTTMSTKRIYHKLSKGVGITSRILNSWD